MDRKEVEQKIREILADRLDTTIEKIQPAVRLIDDLGMDSLKAVEVMFEVEDHFGIKLSDNVFKTVKTVQDISDVLNGYIKNDNSDSRARSNSSSKNNVFSLMDTSIDDYSSEKIFFRIAANHSDLNKIEEIRFKVFVSEDKYPPEKVKVNENDYNLLGYIEGIHKGTISVSVGQAKNLSLGSVVGWGEKNIAEIHKLAILSDARKTKISLGLMVLAYEYAKQQVDDVLAFCLRDKEQHLKTCQEFGFKIIKEFLFLERPAVILHLNVKETIFEHGKSAQKLRFINQLLIK